MNEELEQEIDEEWKVLTEELPAEGPEASRLHNDQPAEELENEPEGPSTGLPEEMEKKMEEEWEGSIKEYPVSQ